MNQSIEIALMHSEGLQKQFFIGRRLSCSICLSFHCEIYSVRPLGSTRERGLGKISAEAINRLLIVCCDRRAHVNWLRSDRFSLKLVSFLVLLRDDLSDGWEFWGICSLSTVRLIDLLNLELRVHIRF